MKRIVVFSFLSLISFAIGAAETMEMNINKFGDVVIQYTPCKHLPNLSPYQNQLVVMSGAPDGFSSESLPFFLGRTEKLGNLFGNEYASKKFPSIQDGMTVSGCSVVFIQHKCKTFVVLVQVKKRPYLMNAQGFADRGESFKNAAIREAFEETGLTINPHLWKSLAVWTYDQKFAGLSIPGRAVAGYAFSKMPVEWADQISGPVSKIDICGSDEIENITLFDIAYLPEYQKFNADGVFSTKFVGHHFNLVLVAAVRAGVAPEEWLQLQEPVGYLTSFKFFEESE